MRRKVFSLLILFLAISFHVSRAAAFDWDPVSDAEKNMKTNPLDPGAGAVVLFKHGQIEVLEKPFWTARIVTYVRIKIFNDAGRDAGSIVEQTYNNVRISRLEGRTILPSGEIIPLDSSKIFRGKAFTEGKDFAVMQTSFTFPSVQPGAIIEYQIEANVDTIFPPPWIFDTQGVGTLQSSLHVLIGPRLNMAQFPLESTTNKISITQKATVQGTAFDFDVNNLRPIQSEPFSLPFRDQATMIIFTPRELAFNGQLFPIITRWDDVATRMSKELADMEKGDKNVSNKAKELAEKLPDPQKKAEAIYKFIQQNITSSNLVGVYLGRTAEEVLNTKRGDPDEINALFILMLKEAKIDSDMVLVATKNWQTLVGGFPNRSQFSRIVTRLNFSGGAVFADPADPAASFGDLPWFDRGVLGLVVKGSKIQQAMIPEGLPEDNVSNTSATIQVAKDWTLNGDAQLDLKGAEEIDFRDNLLEQAPEKAEQFVTDFFAFGHADSEVSQVVHPELRDSSQPFVLKAHIRDRLTTEAGPGELLLNPWIGDQYQRPVFRTTVRHTAVRFPNPEKRVSISTWQLAPEIKVEQLPKEEKIENDLGGYSHSCVQNGATVTCIRTYYLKKTLLQTTTEYLNAKKFFDEIAKDDQEVVLLKGE